MAIDRSDVQRIARLARLALDDDQIGRMTKDLSAILSYVEKIQELDLQGVEPLAIAAERSDPLRADDPDRCDPLLDPPQALAPEWRDGFFLLPRLPALDSEELGAGEEEEEEEEEEEDA